MLICVHIRCMQLILSCRTRTSKTDIRQEQRNETVRKKGTLQPIKNILNKVKYLYHRVFSKSVLLFN